MPQTWNRGQGHSMADHGDTPRPATADQLGPPLRPSWRERFGLIAPGESHPRVNWEPTSRQQAAFSQDTDHDKDTRALYFNWLWFAYSDNDAAAETAREKLITAINTQHEAARRLARSSPYVVTGTRNRPRSKDE